MIVVTVTTAFANGDGAQPTLTIGEESGSATKFAAAAKFTGAAGGTTFAFAGILTSAKKLQAVLVPRPATSTGAYTIDVDRRRVSKSAADGPELRPVGRSTLSHLQGLHKPPMADRRISGGVQGMALRRAMQRSAGGS
jgi:hypothetical protein